MQGWYKEKGLVEELSMNENFISTCVDKLFGGN